MLGESNISITTFLISIARIFFKLGKIAERLHIALIIGHNQWRRQVIETGGDAASAVGARLLGGFGGMPPRKIFICRVSKTLFPAFSGKFYDNLTATQRRFLL